MRYKIILFIVMILISSVYALEPGKLWINGVFIPYSVEEEIPEEPEIPTTNQKNMDMYSSKEVFLISDKNWKDVLSLVPVTTWTEEDGIHKYPTLIWHEENNAFDIDSIYYFFEQYNANKISYFGNLPTELQSLLQDSFNIGQKQKILDYWQSYKDVVYVKDNYTLDLVASTYASLINAPLIIEGTELANDNSIFNNRNVICIGNPTGRTCNEQYNLVQLQQKYIDETKTDKIILVNPNDLDIFVEESFKPSKSSLSINNLYGGSSLLAPILASSKHELILNVPTNNYLQVDSSLQNKINQLNLNPNYLTIFASPLSIDIYMPDSQDGVDEVDNHIYGNLDNKGFQEMSVGRIFGLTKSDISSLVARILFYDKIPHSNKFTMLWFPSFTDQKLEAISNDEILSALDFQKESIYMDDSEIYLEYWLHAKTDLEDRFYINWLDHGSSIGWTTTTNDEGIDTNKLRRHNVKLSPSLVVAEACLTCAFDTITEKNKLFCINMLRHGALGYIGSVEPIGGQVFISKNILEGMINHRTIGESFKDYKNAEVLYWEKNRLDSEEDPSNSYEVSFILLGDPTFNFEFPDSNLVKETKVNYDGESENLLIVTIEIPVYFELIVDETETTEPRHYYLKPTRGKGLLRDEKHLAIINNQVQEDMIEQDNLDYMIDLPKYSDKKIIRVSKVEFIDALGDTLEIPFTREYNKLYHYWWSRQNPYNYQGARIYLRTDDFSKDYLYLDAGFVYPKDKLLPKIKYRIYLELGEPTPTTNQKNMDMYSSKEVFLISDKNWKDVLSLVPITTWTEEDGIHKYPTLIYHEEDIEQIHISRKNFDFEVKGNGKILGFPMADQDLKSWFGTDFNRDVPCNSEFTITFKIDFWGGYQDSLHIDNFKIIYPKYLKPLDNVYYEINQDFKSGDVKEFPVRFKIGTVKVFDVDSIIYFMQQYNTEKVTIVGEKIEELDRQLISTLIETTGLTQAEIEDVNNPRIKRFKPEDLTKENYLDNYWEDYKDVVYVEDDYELALLAATYASLINAPLIIEETSLDSPSVFNARNVILIGDNVDCPSNAKECISDEFDENNNGKYSLTELQKKYVDKTKTDKIILVNPNDLNIKVGEKFVPDCLKGTGNAISELYSKTSLATPILASSKHELIIPIKVEESPINVDCNNIKSLINNINEIDNFVNDNVGLLQNLVYLTILSSPNSIPQSFNKVCDKHSYWYDEKFSTDNIYASSDSYMMKNFIYIYDVVRDSENAYYVYSTMLNKRNSLIYQSYNFLENTFSKAKNIVPDFQFASNPKIDIDLDKNINLIFRGRKFVGGKTSLFYLKMNKKGDILQENKIFEGDYKVVGKPDMIVGSDNIIHIIWTVLRDSPYGSDVYYGKIIDGNLNFIKKIGETVGFTSEKPKIFIGDDNLVNVLWMNNEGLEQIKVDNNGKVIEKKLLLTRDYHLRGDIEIIEDLNGNLVILTTGFTSIGKISEFYFLYLDNEWKIIKTSPPDYNILDIWIENDMINFIKGNEYDEILYQGKIDLKGNLILDNEKVENFEIKKISDKDFYLRFGRIYGITLSDTSSYLARVLFDNEINYDKNKGLSISPSFESLESQEAASRVTKKMNSKGYEWICLTEDEKESCLNIIQKTGPHPDKEYFENKYFISYDDHGWSGGWKKTLNYNEIPELKQTFAIGDACSTNDFEKGKSELFGIWFLRKGGTGYIGASGMSWFTYILEDNIKKKYVDIATDNLMQKGTIGELYLKLENKFGGVFKLQYLFYGDPTFEVGLEK